MSVVADMPVPTATFLDDLTPDSGLALRRWSPEEFRRMACPSIFGPNESLELVDGEIYQARERRPRLFNRRDYYRLAEQGILTPEERTELIYGRIIERMSPMGRPHSIAVSKTAAALVAAFGEGYAVEQQMPMQLGSGLEPQPDVMVVPGTVEDYLDAPLAADILLLVEISDTTARYDRGTKAALYAADAIPDYWQVVLRTRTLEVRRQPKNGTYLSVAVYSEGESIAPLAVPHSSVRVADLLPLPQPRKIHEISH